jgi:membrane protease YdiL (CAAX protease family)
MSKTGTEKELFNLPSDALLCSMAMLVFAFFAPFTFPLKLISIGTLIVPAYIIAKSIDSDSELLKITGKRTTLPAIILYSAASVAFGLILGVLYRWKLDESLFPERFRWFALAAAAIGVTEELLFRGFIQEAVKYKGAVFSIAFSTLAHTSYKTLLFMSPANTHHINIWFLASWTMLAGLIMGTVRHTSGSIIPSLSAHAVFDIIVYGGLLSSPWWVW